MADLIKHGHLIWSIGLGHGHLDGLFEKIVLLD
jgi:hypothetical protein